MEFYADTQFGEMSPTSDFGIVPDDSPAQSPSSSYGYDAIYSPASSDVESVDSAFEELAEVIPEIESDLASQGSPKTYSNLKNANSWDVSYSCYESDSGCWFDEANSGNVSLYDSSYNLSSEEYEPEKEQSELLPPQLLRAAGQASTKRPASFWFSDTFDLSEIPASVVTPKRIKISAPQAVNKGRDNIWSGLERAKRVHQEDPCKTEHTVDEQLTVNSRAILEEKNAVTKEVQGSFLLDENVLTKSFEALAQYLCSDLPVTDSQEKCSAKPEIKEEEESIDNRHNFGTLTGVMQNKNESNPSLTTQMRDHIVQEPAIMFSMSNTKTSQTEPKKVSLKKSANQATAELIRNWKAPSRQKQSHLTLQPSKPRLYNFLLELLQDPASYSCIEWVDRSQGIFKFLDSAKIASLWGHRKNKPNMKYENFARSLRTYIAKGILNKPRNKLVYQFTAKVF